MRYTRIFENMVLHGHDKAFTKDGKQGLITVRCNCDYFEKRERKELPEYGFLIYTGPIDSYFASQGMPKLEYFLLGINCYCSLQLLDHS